MKKHFKLITLFIYCSFALAKLVIAQEVNSKDSLILLLREGYLESPEKIDEYLDLLETFIENSPNISERYAGEALEMAINQNDAFLQLRALNILGRSKNVKNDFLAGFDYLYESIKLSDSLNIPQWKIKNLNALGVSNYEMGNMDNALSFWKQARELNLKIGDTLELAKNSNNLGLVFRNAEKYDSALYYFQFSVELAQKNNFTRGLGVAYSNIATTYSVIGNESKAIFYYQKALKYLSTSENKKSEMALKLAMAKANIRNGNLSQAKVYLNESMEIAERLQSSTYHIDILSLLSNISEQQLNYKEALAYFKKMKVLSDELKDTQSKAELAELEYLILLENIEKENKLLKLENTARMQEMEVQKNRVNRQIIIIIFISLVLLISAIFVVTLLSYNKKQKLANQEMANLNTLLKENQAEIEKQAAQLLEKNKQIEFINTNLEARVKERTLEIAIKNEQLKKYAYSNSHHVRGPLARIMGLTELIRRETEDPKVTQFMNKLEIVSQELDIIIRNIADNLHTEFGGLEEKK